MKVVIDEDILNKLKDMTVLYVEDEEDVRVNFVRILMRRSGKVYTANDGQEGIYKFNEVKPDIVLTDIQMPNLDGLSMCEEIRKTDSNVQLIITSAYDVGLNSERVKNLNIMSYLKKPIDRQELIKSLSDSVVAIMSNKI